MSEDESAVEIRAVEQKLIGRYSLLTKFLLLLTFILIICVVVVIIGTIVLSYGYNWLGLSLSNWLLVISIVFVFFIVIDLLVFYHYRSVRDKRIELERPKPEYIDGKRVHVYTSPKGIEGGIFSKTYIAIDDHNILRLRTLIVDPEELWSQTE